MRINHPRIALLAVGLAAAGVTAVLAFAAPAAATGGHDCTTITHGDTVPFVNRNAADTANTNGTYTLTTDGVKIVTPDNDAKIYGYLPLSPSLKLTDIYDAGFKNINGSGLAPSYQFGLSVNGAWGGTLAWEQTYQPDGYKGTDDVLHNGNSKWYITKDHPGYAHHTVKTWKELLALLPKDTVATYYGLNQGAGGIATNTVDQLQLKTKSWCKVHTWDTKYTPSPSPSISKSPSPSPSVSASASASKSAGPSVTPTGLPVTGASPGGTVLVGVGLLLVGVVLVGGVWYASRRRRVEFTP